MQQAQLSLDINTGEIPSGTAIKLLRKICRYAEKKNKLGEVIGWVMIKVGTFAEWLGGITKRHVYRLEEELERLGYIERVRQPGGITTIYPRVHSSQIPGWESHVPVPAGPPTKPMLENIPARRRPRQHAVPPGAPAPSQSSPAVSPLLSRGTSSHSTTNVDKSEKQLRQTGEKRDADVSEVALPPEAWGVVATMRKCGVWGRSIAKLVDSLGVATLEDAFGVTLRRIEKGNLSVSEDDCAGYALNIARRVKSGEWKLPGWWLAERGRAERSAEREAVATNRAVRAADKPAAPKLPVPAAWLPGVPEGEARDLLRLAFDAVRNGTGHAPDPLSDVVRDQARWFWRKKNGGAPVPWDELPGTNAPRVFPGTSENAADTQTAAVLWHRHSGKSGFCRELVSADVANAPRVFPGTDRGDFSEAASGIAAIRRKIGSARSPGGTASGNA